MTVRMSLTPQDNSRLPFTQPQSVGRQHVFQLHNSLPSPSPAQQQQQQNAFQRPLNGIRPQQILQAQGQVQQHNSGYATPYAQVQPIGSTRTNGNSNGNAGVSAEQQIAQGVLQGASVVSSNNTPQRRPPPLGKTIHMPPHSAPSSQSTIQSMTVNHAMNPITNAQRQSQNGSPAQNMNLVAQQQQQQGLSLMTPNSNIVARTQGSSPDGSAQDLSMIDPQLAVDQQLNSVENSMLTQQMQAESPQLIQGEMMSAPPAGSFPTFDALFAFAQAHALAHGYAFVIGRSKRDNRGLKKVFLICDRGGTNKEKVPGEQRQRKTKSRKCGCEFGVFGLENKTAWLLRGRIDGEHLTHNHPPSDSPTEHPGARKLDPKAIAAVKALEENGVSVKETLEILHRDNPTVRYLPRDIYNARAAIKRDPSRVEATAMEELPTFYKKPPMTFEEKLRAELRTEVANAQAETQRMKEEMEKKVEELQEQLRHKDLQIRKFEQFIDILNERAMARREELDGEPSRNTS